MERTFGRLKNEYGLAPLRVRDIERVALHADLTMLARLRVALAQRGLFRSRSYAPAFRYSFPQSL